MLNKPLELFTLPSVELITEYLAWDLNIKSHKCGIWKKCTLTLQWKITNFCS